MASDLAAEKRRIRHEISRLRRSIPSAEAERVAGAIASRLLAEAGVRRARRIALYAALSDEVPTRPLFDALRSLHQNLLFPRSQPANQLVFAAVNDWSELRPGRYGVLEPPAAALAVAPEEGDLVFVPGVAFDRAGNRLGRGKGFYDQAFPVAAPRPPLLVGVAYTVQFLDALPHAASDRPMDAVVTESAFHWMGTSAS